MWTRVAKGGHHTQDTGTRQGGGTGTGGCGEEDPPHSLSRSRPNVHHLVFGMVSVLTSIYPNCFMCIVRTVNLPPMPNKYFR